MNRYAVSAALLWLTAFDVCAAAAAKESISIQLSLADLDLTTDSGRASAHARVAAAAARLCKRFENDEKIDHRETLAGCIRDAEGDALAQLEHLVEHALKTKTPSS
jgi:UrcA family protein